MIIEIRNSDQPPKSLKESMSLSSGQRHMVITLSGEELADYGVSFESMSLDDPGTRIMLRDMLNLMEHMKLKSVGEQVHIDCAKGEMGGCVLVLGSTGKGSLLLHIASADTAAQAAQAGALTDNDRLKPDDEGGGFTVITTASGQRLDLLREFCD